MSTPLLRVEDLRVAFGNHSVLQGIDFEMFAGETVGLVGESGSGKSTLARAILRLLPARGRVQFAGVNLLDCTRRALQAQRRYLQIVFQDPLASLNPRMRVADTLAEPLKIFEPQLDARTLNLRVAAMLERVGLTQSMARRYPHEFSGGQCQRVGIARAMMLNPKLLICDEPVSSLDVSIQGQIVNLLLDLQREAGTTLLFISHNLALVRHMSHRVLVLYAGRLVEYAGGETLFAAPSHPYTRMLLAAVPKLPHCPGNAASRPVHRLPLAASAEPLEAAGQRGCAYRPRCAHAVAECSTTVPALREVARAHGCACHRAGELLYS